MSAAANVLASAALWVATAALLGGCYQVTYPDSYACNAEFPQCPAGQTCDESNGVCVKGGITDSQQDAPPDAGADLAPDGGSDSEADATPDLGPDLVADLAADLTPDLTPDLPPDLAPDSVGAPDLTPDLTPDLGAADGGTTSKWVTVKAGTFTMGSTSSADSCFEPNAHLGHRETAHSVTLTRDFAISSLAVTQAQLKAARGYAPASFAGCPQCPVENITWSEAAAYCNALSTQAKLIPCYTCTSAFGPADVKCSTKLGYAGAKLYACPGYRLPTEAEYEYAHRAGSTTPLTTGKLVGCGKDAAADALGWYKYNAKNQTQAVGQKPKNALGLYDMAGNALSWCQDSWSDDLGSSSQTDPLGTTASAQRAMRGASWSSPASHLRAAFRAAGKETSRFSTVGVRCVRTLKP